MSYSVGATKADGAIVIKLHGFQGEVIRLRDDKKNDLKLGLEAQAWNG